MVIEDFDIELVRGEKFYQLKPYPNEHDSVKESREKCKKGKNTCWVEQTWPDLFMSYFDNLGLNFFIALTNHSDSCYVTDSMFLLLLVDFKLLKAKTETSFNVW